MANLPLTAAKDSHAETLSLAIALEASAKAASSLVAPKDLPAASFPQHTTPRLALTQSVVHPRTWTSAGLVTPLHFVFVFAPPPLFDTFFTAPHPFLDTSWPTLLPITRTMCI